MQFTRVVALVCILGGAIALPASAAIQVYVAYYDNEHPSGFIPDPWKASSQTLFFGNTDSSGVWDGGAIRFLNIGDVDEVLSPGVRVDGFADGSSFRLWDAILTSGRHISPGQNLVLAQPNTGAFDTSDQPIIDIIANRTNNHPVVHFTLDGQLYALTDVKQVLNTGGFDPGNAEGISESVRWGLLGTVPEPAGSALALAPCVAVWRRRRGA